MHVRRSSLGYEVLAPAKLNLSLRVLAKRDDGFHEIETLLAPIAWYDTLHVAAAPAGAVTLECDWPAGRTGIADGPGAKLPSGDDNLAVRAVRLLAQRTQVQQGARIKLVKRIPLAAGLGGGSSDAAAALLAARLVWGLDVSLEELTALGAELGSDVPFFLSRGAAIGRGRGELLEPVDGLPTLHFVVVRPPEGLATPAVYGACRPDPAAPPADALVTALRAGRLADAGRRLFNALEEAAAKLSGWIGRLRDEFSRWDFLGAQMSGSGTSYFGLCRTARHARRLAAALRGRGVGQAVAVSTCD